MKRFALLVASGCLAFSVLAQEPSRGPDGGTSLRVSGVEVLPIPGKPFSAKSSTQWIRTLEDGSTVRLRLEARIARDSQGRVYRERHHFVPENSSGPSPLHEIHIYDPVDRTQMLCNGRTYRCILSEYRPRTFFETAPEGESNGGARNLTRERLGTDTIDGIFVTGTRETVTVSPGAAGNERPLVSTREFWYSDELQTNLAVTRVDPETGTQIIRLSDVSRTEPDTHLWEVPIGFTVRDVRTAAQRRR